MVSDKQSDMARIKHLGRLLRQVTLALILLTLPVVVLVFATQGPLALVNISLGGGVHQNVVVNDSVLHMPQSLAIMAVGLLTPATYLLAMAFLYQLFGLYAQGIVFSQRNVTILRRIGYTLIAVDLVKIIQSALTGPVLGWLGVVKPYLTIEFGIGALVVGLAIVLISHVMNVGCRIYETDQLTI
jgi:hypothetical protein